MSIELVEWYRIHSSRLKQLQLVQVIAWYIGRRLLIPQRSSWKIQGCVFSDLFSLFLYLWIMFYHFIATSSALMGRISTGRNWRRITQKLKFITEILYHLLLLLRMVLILVLSALPFESSTSVSGGKIHFVLLELKSSSLMLVLSLFSLLIIDIFFVT